MEKDLTTVTCCNIDKENLRKSLFVLSTKGSNLSQAVRELTEKLAKEYDEKENN